MTMMANSIYNGFRFRRPLARQLSPLFLAALPRIGGDDCSSRLCFHLGKILRESLRNGPAMDWRHWLY